MRNFIFWLKKPWVIFGAALIVRLIYISCLKEGYYFSDFRTYERSALSLMAGRGFDLDYARPPFYPLFLALNYLLFGPHFFPIRVVQAILGAFSSVLIFQATNRILNIRAAQIAAWISIFYPYYVFISGLLYPTLLAAFFLISTIYLLIISVQENSLVNLGLASVCLALAALAVPMSLTFLPFVMLWFLCFLGWGRGRRILAVMISFLIVVACLVPWTYYCYTRTGHFVVVDSRLSDHLFITSPELRADLKHDSTATSRLNDLMNHPSSYLRTVTGEFLHFFSFVPDRVVTRSEDYRQRIHHEDPRLIIKHIFVSPLMNWLSILTYGPVFIFALVGILLQRRSWRILFFPIMLVLSHALGYSIFFSQVRYRLPVEFCLMILAAGGVAIIGEKYDQKRSQVKLITE